MVSSLLRGLWRAFRQDLAAKLISVFLAIVLWVSVSGISVVAPLAPTQRTIGNVDVIGRDLNPIDTVIEVTPRTVAVTVRGPGDQIDRLTARDFVASVDLRAASTGQTRFFVDVAVPPGLQLVDVQPRSVVMTIGRAVAKSLPVEVQVDGTPAKGYSLGMAKTTPSSVVVRGSSQAVNTVARVVAHVNVNEATSAVSSEQEVVPLTETGALASGVTIWPNRVAVLVPVTTAPAGKTVPVEGVISGSPANGYAVKGIRTDPAQVTLQGPKDVLDGLSKIFTKTVDVSGAAANVVMLAPLDLPPGVAAAQPAEVQVTVEIVKMR